MSPAFRRTLPARPDLEQQKKLAKELLRAFRDNTKDAAARVRAELPDKTHVTLADAQFVLAREYGFTNWAELSQHIALRSIDALPPIDRFRKAVRDRDAKSLRRVLADHLDVRARINEPLFSFDSSALLSVVGDLELVDVLLAFGADPNRRSSWWAGGFHALHSARGAVAERLIAAGSVPDACAAANLDSAELLVRLLAEDAMRVHERGGDGQTPLHFARSRQVADLLLDSGADPDARDIDHRSSPAEWMLGDGVGSARWDLARYLVGRGASADIFLVAALGLRDRTRAMLEADPGLLALRTGQGTYGERPPSSYHIYQWTIGPNLSPLQTAAKFQQDDTLRVMETFASPEQRLLLACHRGERGEALGIVERHPGIVAALGPADRRALTDEAWAANAPAVRLMLELGFDPSVPSNSGPTGGTALHCAAWEGSVDCVSAILQYPSGHALLEVRDRTYKGTPLGWCGHGSLNCGSALADHAAVARLLIAAGAALDAEMAEWEGSEPFQEVIASALSDRASA
jgi:hypothetical protein